MSLQALINYSQKATWPGPWYYPTTLTMSNVTTVTAVTTVITVTTVTTVTSHRGGHRREGDLANADIGWQRGERRSRPLHFCEQPPTTVITVTTVTTANAVIMILDPLRAFFVLSKNLNIFLEHRSYQSKKSKLKNVRRKKNCSMIFFWKINKKSKLFLKLILWKLNVFFSLFLSFSRKTIAILLVFPWKRLIFDRSLQRTTFFSLILDYCHYCHYYYCYYYSTGGTMTGYLTMTSVLVFCSLVTVHSLHTGELT